MDPTLPETLAALDLPREGVEKWLAHLRRKCGRHGGQRLYAGLLVLVEECEAALAREKP